MPDLPNILDAISLEVYYQPPGVATKNILSNCLYRVDDPHELNEILSQLELKRLFRATQRKATNWLIFRFKDNTCLMTDLDEEAGELRVTTEQWVQEYRVNKKTASLLTQHIMKARLLYGKAHK